MGFIILLGTLAGKYLDRHFQLQKPVFTLILSLVSVFAALYISLKDFLFKGK
jgi:MFS-type transporter involved in bile tolerance (Atg22 family)